MDLVEITMLLEVLSLASQLDFDTNVEDAGQPSTIVSKFFSIDVFARPV